MWLSVKAPEISILKLLTQTRSHGGRVAVRCHITYVHQETSQQVMGAQLAPAACEQLISLCVALQASKLTR